MSNECCKEFSGWCRAFTRAERALVVLEAALLALLLALLVFVTLHMIVCSSPMTYVMKSSSFILTGKPKDLGMEPETDAAITNKSYKNHITENPKVKCTWKPSVKTEAVTHYYYTGKDNQITTTASPHPTTPHTTTTSPDEYYMESDVQTVNEIINPDEFVQSDVSDGEEVNDKRKSFVLALVKMKPPNDITFGCILTIISEYWVVTAASCIEAIEELDSLDSFVMMEEYGITKGGQIHTIADLQVHPFYRETNKSYDVAALRSEDSLLRRDKRPVQLVSSIDDALVAIGERLHLLGYGAFRSIEYGRSGRRLRVAYVYSVAARLCEATRDAGASALRHLTGGRREGDEPPPASRRRLCAGVLAARGLPCNYCAGAPLLLPDAAGGDRLLALMVESLQCGVACEPNFYLPLVLVQDWIDRVLSQ